MHYTILHQCHREKGLRIRYRSCVYIYDFRDFCTQLAFYITLVPSIVWKWTNISVWGSIRSGDWVHHVFLIAPEVLAALVAQWSVVRLNLARRTESHELLQECQSYRSCVAVGLWSDSGCSTGTIAEWMLQKPSWILIPPASCPYYSTRSSE